MLVEVEFAKTAAYNACFHAAECLDTGEGWDDFLEAAHIAKAFCSEAYFHAAAENIQVHGGMGFTWESDLHLFFRRARALYHELGDPSWCREQVARAMLDVGAYSCASHG